MVCGLSPGGNRIRTIGPAPAKDSSGRVFFLFDLLHLDGEEIAPMPVTERKERLRARREPARERSREDARVGATFQLGGKFGVGRCGGIENTSLISLTSEERRTRPHMLRS
jgi:hypothetical protein